MNQEDHSSDNIPELRFPEFQDLDAWEEKLLESLSLRISDGIHATPIYDDKGEYYFINGNNLVRGIIEVNEATKKVSEEEYKKHRRDLGQNTILLSINGTIGSISVYNNEKVVLGKSACYINIDNKKANKYFIIYFLHTKKAHNFFLSELTGSTIMNLSLKTVKNIIIDLPSRSEQQKISDCLSSLDELINTQIQKLNVLKAHKKGLMQQLFPAEGETVPKLRFAEFRDEGEWEEKILSQISSSIFDGTHQTPTYTKEGIPFFSVENIISRNKNKFISREDYLVATNKNKPEKGDILITRIGNIGFSTIVDWDYEFSIYVTLAVVKKTVQFDSYYLHCFFQSERYQTEIRSKSLLNAVPCKINMDELRTTKVLLPSQPEQQKIAECLSSIDDFITAQSQKLDALKVHKKGLMQGLFPQTSEL